MTMLLLLLAQTIIPASRVPWTRVDCPPAYGWYSTAPAIPKPQPAGTLIPWTRIAHDESRFTRCVVLVDRARVIHAPCGMRAACGRAGE
jgi:hypothetical protein